MELSPARAGGKAAFMGILDMVLGLFGGGGKVNFGKMNPDNVEDYWRADHEVDQGERQGPDAHRAALAKWGFSSAGAFENAQGAMAQRHQHNPDFAMAASRVQYEVQMQSVAATYQIPPQYQAPVEGIDLERLATIRARIDLARQAPHDILAEYRLDPPRWQNVEGTWQQRMGGRADAMAASMLNSMYHQFYTHAKAAYGR
jgi:hypothetical protein